MPFLGRSPADGNLNTMLDAVTTSSTATYNLTKNSVAYTPISAQSLMVSLNGVTQAPGAAYTVSGNTITFASDLTTDDVIDYIIAFEGPVKSIDASNIAAGALTGSMLGNNAVDTGQIADDAVGSDQLDGSLTVDINGGAIDGAIVGANSAAAGTFTALTSTGTSTHATVDINGGAIDGAVIGANSAAAGTFSTVADASGAIRAIPLNDQNSTYSLVAGDVGKVIDAAGTVTIPASVFSAGDAISIFNNTASDLTITCSAITTVYKAGENSDIGSATLATRGVATILFISATVCVIGGNI